MKDYSQKTVVLANSPFTSLERVNKEKKKECLVLKVEATKTKVLTKKVRQIDQYIYILYITTFHAQMTL